MIDFEKNQINQQPLHNLFCNRELLVFTNGQDWFDQQLEQAYRYWIEQDSSFGQLIDTRPIIEYVHLWAQLNGYQI